MDTSSKKKKIIIAVKHEAEFLSGFITVSHEKILNTSDSLGKYMTLLYYLQEMIKLLSPVKSWWIRSAKLGSSPHQNIHSSLLPGLWSRRQTPSTSALRQRLKLLKMGSSSVTGNRIGAEVGPCHTYLFHLIPVKSAWKKESMNFFIIAQSQRYSLQSRLFH